MKRPLSRRRFLQATGAAAAAAVVVGNCGFSPFPIAEEIFEDTKAKAKSQFGVDLARRDLKGFFAALEKGGTALNYATLVGHGAVRGAAMGFNDRAPKPDELQKMKALLAAALRDGAAGLSTGLEYTPGCFADLVVFDPASAADRATWKDPHQYPAGIVHVVVNGVAVVSDGEHTGKLPGHVLRKVEPA